MIPTVASRVAARLSVGIPLFGPCAECSRSFAIDDQGNVVDHAPSDRSWMEQEGCMGAGKPPRRAPALVEAGRWVENFTRMTSYGGGSAENELLRLLCLHNPPAAALEIERLRERVEDLNTKLGHGPKRFDMTALARSFPSFAHWKDVPGLDAGGSFNFDARAFFAWASSTNMSHGEYCVVQFLADVWNGNDCKKLNGSSTKARERVMGVAKFDLHEALGVWDSGHRAAFLAWAKEPWFP